MKKWIRDFVFGVSLMLVLMSGFYIGEVKDDFNLQCSTCVTQDCMDNDIVCGDFGFYWVKFGILFGMLGMGASFNSMLIYNWKGGEMK